MKKTYYTNAPDPMNEDYQLPYFLKDDEKYVELMAAVYQMLNTFPEFSSQKDWSRLNEAYHQVLGHPHPYATIPANRSLSSTLSPATIPPWVSPYRCMWCNTSVTSHR